MSKLTALHINIIGVVVSLVLAVVLFFFMIKPKNEDIEKVQAETKTTKEGGGTEEAKKQSERDLKKEQDRAAKAKADWNVYAAKYMPKLNYDPKTDLIAAQQSNFYVDRAGVPHGLRDLPEQWGRWVGAWYRAQAISGIDSQVPIFAIPAYDSNPNSISGMKNLTFPEPGKPWDVTVQAKNFDVAMAHLKRFNGMQGHGMPVIDNVSLQGQSPNLLMRYSLALYVIPGSDPPPADPKLGTGGGGAAGGGGGRMPGMGGMPGMSGMSGMSSMMGGSMGGGAAGGGGKGKGAAGGID